jgi:hypothetical protein
VILVVASRKITEGGPLKDGRVRARQQGEIAHDIPQYLLSENSDDPNVFVGRVVTALLVGAADAGVPVVGAMAVPAIEVQMGVSCKALDPVNACWEGDPPGFAVGQAEQMTFASRSFVLTIPIAHPIRRGRHARYLVLGISTLSERFVSLPGEVCIKLADLGGHDDQFFVRGLKILALHFHRLFQALGASKFLEGRCGVLDPQTCCFGQRLVTIYTEGSDTGYYMALLSPSDFPTIKMEILSYPPLPAFMNCA